MNISRAEHLAWCKQRALECLNRSGVSDALASMGSDLDKHTETEKHPGIQIGVMMLMAGQLTHPQEMKRFIEGFH